MVGTLVQEPRSIGPDGGRIDHLQEKRIVRQEIKNAGIVALDLGHPRVRGAALLKCPPLGDDPLEGLAQPRDMRLGQEMIQHQVAVVIEEEALGRRRPGLQRHGRRLLSVTPLFAFRRPASCAPSALS